MRIYEKATNEPQFRIGLNGNYYVFCKIKKPLEDLSSKIGKSSSSIYFNEKYRVFAIRVKLKKHKQELDKIFRRK
ncbi:gp269 [Bacillus phage G]|uniref:Gp269 n=1 Tax=Bacillus phage G TaxID=2884420 RepID=G3MA10_9CAUD|nr:gp269 [Bacillus phage G]AEO93528.1 gp269 [Bacillus phage G]